MIILWIYEIEALVQGGNIELAQEDIQCFGQRCGDNRRYRLPYLRSLAALAHWPGYLEQAIAHLEAALAQAEEIGLPGEQWLILAALGNLYRSGGDEEKAQQVLALADEIGQALAAKIDDEDLRGGFLAATAKLLSPAD